MELIDATDGCDTIHFGQPQCASLAAPYQLAGHVTPCDWTCHLRTYLTAIYAIAVASVA
jgi:hypothetical protein